MKLKTIASLQHGHSCFTYACKCYVAARCRRGSVCSVIFSGSWEDVIGWHLVSSHYWHTQMKWPTKYWDVCSVVYLLDLSLPTSWKKAILRGHDVMARAGYVMTTMPTRILSLRMTGNQESGGGQLINPSLPGKWLLKWYGVKDQFPIQGIQHHTTSCLDLSVSSYKKFHYHHHFQSTSENNFSAAYDTI